MMSETKRLWLRMAGACILCWTVGEPGRSRSGRPCRREEQAGRDTSGERAGDCGSGEGAGGREAQRGSTRAAAGNRSAGDCHSGKQTDQSRAVAAGHSLLHSIESTGAGQAVFGAVCPSAAAGRGTGAAAGAFWIGALHAAVEPGRIAAGRCPGRHGRAAGRRCADSRCGAAWRTLCSN